MNALADVHKWIAYLSWKTELTYNFIENTKFLLLCFNLDYQIKFSNVRIDLNVQTEIILTEYTVVGACNGLTASLYQWFSISSMFMHLKSSAGGRDPYTENLNQLTIGFLSLVIFYSAFMHNPWTTGKKNHQLRYLHSPPPHSTWIP